MVAGERLRLRRSVACAEPLTPPLSLPSPRPPGPAGRVALYEAPGAMRQGVPAPGVRVIARADGPRSEHSGGQGGYQGGYQGGGQGDQHAVAFAIEVTAMSSDPHCAVPSTQHTHSTQYAVRST